MYSEANRKLYHLLLTAVAPPKVDSTDPTSLVPKIARAIGVDRKSTAWLGAISHRKAIDDPKNKEPSWEQPRKRRFDALSPAEESHIEKFWEENTTPSPSERDVKRHRIGPGQYIRHQAHEQHKKTRALLADYNSENSDSTIGYGTFQRCKPFFVRPPCAQTCLCRYCENVRMPQKALHLNQKIFLDLDAER